MPRRRRVDDIGCSITSEHITIDDDNNLKPTLNRFAEDTSMLGFRYLHTRYKTWFRVLWAFILIFFLGLTIYQVTERITYYFIKNPLKTLRTYDTPTELPFPAVVICNKLQQKASKVAARSPELLKAMCLVHQDDGTITNKTRKWAELNRFNNTSLLNVYADSYQTVDDFIISCEYGKGRSCLDDIRPILTPKGMCFEVAPNMTVRRPGPETTLSLLLNLEVYEIIPGSVVEAGVMLSLYDQKESPSSVFSEGIHLEAGKVVTIPINDVRKLYRYNSECGRREVGPFSSSHYSRAGCQWAKQFEEVEKICRCRPVHTPFNRKSLLRALEEPNSVKQTREFRRSNKRLPACTVEQEYGCVYNVTSSFPLLSPTDCPEDCQDISFSSVVFGGRLNPSDIESLLPSDWEDVKEKRMEAFQSALEIIPNHRIPVVRSVQQLANEAQVFVQKTFETFGVNSVNSSTVPCLVDNGHKIMERAVKQLFSHERIWKHMNTYLQLVFPYHMDAVFEVLNMNLTSNFSLIYSKGRRELTKDILEQATYNLHMIENSLRDPQNVYGVKSLDHHDRSSVVFNLRRMFGETNNCLTKARDLLEKREIREAEEIVGECKNIFASHFNLLESVHKVIAGFEPEVFSDFEAVSTKLIGALQKLKFLTRPKMFEWRNYEINLRYFEQLYRDGGRDNQEMVELMKLRKIVNSEMTEAINSLTSSIDSTLASRRLFLDRLSIGEGAIESIRQIGDIQQCLRDIVPQLQKLRRFSFIRAEWMSRVERQVEQAQSYSPGQQYDQVNLLHIKLYYAHFKQETIRQEKSYNLFLLLAEIGGTIGLYVGATLLTAAETFVFFIEKRTRKLFVKPQYC